MKKYFLTFTVCLLLVTSAMAQKGNEIDAIKAAIEKETKAFFEIDYKTWLDSWVHAPYAYWSMADSAEIHQFEGWRAIEIGFNDYFITSKPNNAQVERTWMEIRVYGDGAFARFKQRLVSPDGIKGDEQTEIRILEKDKKKNEWKIALVGVLRKG